MKKCFAFKSYEDCKKVRNHLQTLIPSTVHSQISNAITVEEAMYARAILCGKAYVRKEGIDCCWFDDFEKEVPVNMVPFAIISFNETVIVDPYCITQTALLYVSKFVNFFEKIINRKIYTQPRNDGTIAFLIESHHEYFYVQEDVVEKISHHKNFKEYSSNVNFVFTDIYGRPV